MGSGGFGVGLASGGMDSRGDVLWRRMAHEKNRLMSAERTLAFMARTKGWARAYQSRTGPQAVSMLMTRL